MTFWSLIIITIKCKTYFDKHYFSLLRSTFSIPAMSPLGYKPLRLLALVKPHAKMYMPSANKRQFIVLSVPKVMTVTECVCSNEVQYITWRIQNQYNYPSEFSLCLLFSYCVVPENIPIPHPRRAAKIQRGGGGRGAAKEVISKGVEWPLESFFPRAPSKIDEQAISYFTVNWCFKAKIIVFTDDLLFAVGWVPFFTGCRIV